MAPSSPPHLQVVLFPFMSKGHTIPILHLARLLLCHRPGTTVTIFTTPLNHPFISSSLPTTPNISIISLPFPQNIESIPAGVESTDKLPSMDLFPTFATASKLMKTNFENHLKNLGDVTFMVTDGFLSWTLDSANKFGIPRLAYYGMNCYAQLLTSCVTQNQLLGKPKSDDEEFIVPEFPCIKLTRNDFEPVFNDPQPEDLFFQFVMEATAATADSYGLLQNTFYELETVYIDFWNSHRKPRALCVGPLCPTEPPRDRSENHEKPPWIQWLDCMHQQGKSVLYVAFGSQAEICPEQFKEIKIGLEKAEVNFLWVVKRNKYQELDDDDRSFDEERVKERGMLVREWVDQMEILHHGCIQGFLSHCGWNSVMESICAKVPILGWPLAAEQHLNARMVIEELKIGVRVETSGGSVRGFVEAEGLEKSARELMDGEIGKELRKKVKEVGDAAIKAVDQGGSSWATLDGLITELLQARNHV